MSRNIDAVRREFVGQTRPGAGEVMVSEMQKTVKTGMSPDDEKSYLAEYGELWSLLAG